MANYFVLKTPRKNKDGETFWSKVGAAFPRDDGGFNVTLEVVPLPRKNDKTGEMEIFMAMMPPFEDDGRGK